MRVCGAVHAYKCYSKARLPMECGSTRKRISAIGAQLTATIETLNFLGVPVGANCDSRHVTVRLFGPASLVNLGWDPASTLICSHAARKAGDPKRSRLRSCIARPPERLAADLFG